MEGKKKDGKANNVFLGFLILSFLLFKAQTPGKEKNELIRTFKGKFEK